MADLSIGSGDDDCSFGHSGKVAKLKILVF
jgi:hypothetical protein